MNPRVRPAPPALPFPADAPPADDRLRERGVARGEVWEHCPNCGARLVTDRWRYRCPACSYYMSGSDHV